MTFETTLKVIAEHRESQPGPHTVTVAAAQLGGPWLKSANRLARIAEAARVASATGATVIAYPETYLSGYPFWPPRTDGALFDHADQKDCYAYYLDSAIEVGGPEHRELETMAADLGVGLVVGVSERGRDLGSGSVWCTLLTIDPVLGLVGHHRKLIPTYDERLIWAQGDGAGLRTHRFGPAVVGSLNCWENWMPQARNAMYAQGETVHIGSWPGSSTLTADITRFVAAEGRVFSVAASGLITADSIPEDFPLAARLRETSEQIVFDGGSAVAGPDGRWLIPPVVGVEGVLVADLDLARVMQERLNFDVTGHYARPDVFRTEVNRRRGGAVHFTELPAVEP
ncbi:carbon-nitrogen hydrolase family protein [Mycolicibacterium sp. 120266]|jgi:nitrilase|uniref:carbon-nitrogen hydrolase family protein n=1 Tax=Mycolicibacterium sp. 120266 TaxID=3090601 RepID=UPI00299F06AA|nr:carbon-nitrogen hydrolase family protein [Mycolicibacterium sp. 120266]MDX1870800.1 carbon-nitrogen hydrolase family protein [Mycolicibacterium sp. 120266]